MIQVDWRCALPSLQSRSGRSAIACALLILRPTPGFQACSRVTAGRKSDTPCNQTYVDRFLPNVPHVLVQFKTSPQNLESLQYRSNYPLASPIDCTALAGDIKNVVPLCRAPEKRQVALRSCRSTMVLAVTGFGV
ncbi:hypothetical protein NA56DRAFT_336537 [Hyaloscypha hepaticicola]|uniref:Uncharacterized protein n=1 Tax=Hyaloscypha hepaticicola TaxID=2082293 RepID=A0A2J6QIK9_9HELO|nr:hypothetical protein NA56DRAFT_336537 [Hyaloscypha hepaticicola]